MMKMSRAPLCAPPCAALWLGLSGPAQAPSLHQSCHRAGHVSPPPEVLVLQKPQQGPLHSSVKMTSSVVFAWHPPHTYRAHTSALPRE